MMTRFRKPPCSGHLLLMLFVITYTLIHLLTWSLIRYRLPVDSILVLYAAVGVLRLADRLMALKAVPLKEPVL
jgi:hypothetical protein